MTAERVAGIFNPSDVMARLKAAGEPWLELLRRPSMRAGIYRLDAGSPDLQRPHTEDDLYYVIAGTGRFEAAGEVTDVLPGSVIFVEKHVEHHFLDYPDGLTLLVVFAPG